MSTELLKIAMVAVISSQIAAIGYDKDSRTLRITFTDRIDKDTKRPIPQSGSSYDYANVEPETHQALVSSPSIGSYFYANIKPDREKYPYTKLAVHCPPDAPVQEQEQTA